MTWPSIKPAKPESELNALFIRLIRMFTISYKFTTIIVSTFKRRSETSKVELVPPKCNEINKVESTVLTWSTENVFAIIQRYCD